MRFRSLENANPISVQFSYQISAAQGAGTLEIPWFRQPEARERWKLQWLRQPEAQGAMFFLTPLEKTIPKPLKTGLEREASPPKSKGPPAKSKGPPPKSKGPPSKSKGSPPSGKHANTVKKTFPKVPKMYVRSHPHQPKPSGKHTNSVKNAFPKPSKNALPKPSTASQTERELHE